MIFVKNDPSLIPPKLLAVAIRAQAELEITPAEDRKAFIEKKGAYLEVILETSSQNVLRQVLVFREQRPTIIF